MGCAKSFFHHFEELAGSVLGSDRAGCARGKRGFLEGSEVVLWTPLPSASCLMRVVAFLQGSRNFRIGFVQGLDLFVG